MADGGQPGSSGNNSSGGGGSRPGGSSGARRRRRGGRGRSGQSGQGQRTQSSGSSGSTQATPNAPKGSANANGGGRSQSNNRSNNTNNRSRNNRSKNRSQGGGGGQRGSGPRSERQPQVPVLTQQSMVAQGAAPLVDDREVRANRRRARRIAVLGALVPALVVGAVLGVAVSRAVGAIGFAALLVLAALVLPRIATPFALRLVHARALHEDELPRLQNLVDGLCPTFGVRRPILMAVDDDLPNACSLGSKPDRGVLVVTTGLEAALDLTEMEGVIGHELSHFKRCDTLVSSIAVTVLAPVIWLTGGDGLLHRVLGRGRELRADQVAVTAVRYPPGLCDALRRFDASPEPRAGSVFSGRSLSMSRWLWIDPAVGRRGAEAMGDLDLTSVRIDALAEL